MYWQGKKISVSLASVEFVLAGKGTKLVLTEQHAFLDGFEDGGSRERGTRVLMDNLGVALAGGDARRDAETEVHPLARPASYAVCIAAVSRFQSPSGCVKPGAMLSTFAPFAFTNLNAPSSRISMRMPPS